MDKFPGDLADEVARLRAEVNELRALVRQRAPLTTASQGWRMADMAIPSVGPGEIQIGSNGGELFVATSSGTQRLNQLNVPVATPPYPASFTSPATIGGTPTAQNYNDLRADVVNQLFTPLRDVINKGATIGLWPAP
ncbi:hypothetical protein [Nonomuraea wenchangensis]|uniref:Uncharacterized protein n=1 Tax=Nonomuraea wenchangensis TaxID=568860 RepID=A0A1I0ER28_9ACTN|nr:hypothetical protein [Nonomuraea wenchangensis]SET47906.1 hypothetical protein SAMN05421811_103168 [Nonomuraea wenchangensis]